MELGKPVILCGDLNVANREIDIFDPKKTKQAGFTPQERNSFGQFLDTSGFVDTFRHQNPSKTQYSFWNLRSGARAKNQGWRLDYFVTSRSLLPEAEGDQQPRIGKSVIHADVYGSDHCPISLEIVYPDGQAPSASK